MHAITETEFIIDHDGTTKPWRKLKAHLDCMCPTGWKTVIVLRQPNSTTIYKVRAEDSHELLKAKLAWS